MGRPAMQEPRGNARSEGRDAAGGSYRTWAVYGGWSRDSIASYKPFWDMLLREKCPSKPECHMCVMQSGTVAFWTCANSTLFPQVRSLWSPRSKPIGRSGEVSDALCTG